MIICRHCKEAFVSKPGKNRYIDECPRCRPEPGELPPPVTQTQTTRVYELPETKKRIINHLRLTNPRFAKLSRKEAFDRWRNGYLKENPYAKKVLDDVLDIQKAGFWPD
jgi:Zn-finger nucleic acid-binding protein